MTPAIAKAARSTRTGAASAQRARTAPQKGRQPGPAPVDLWNLEHVNRLALDKIEAAQALGVSVDALEDHVLPSLRTVKVGRRMVIAVAELQRWLDANAAVHHGAIR